MYCKRCSAKLTPPPEDPALASGPWLGGNPGEIPYASPRNTVARCAFCFRKYDPDNASTYRESLILSPKEIAVKIILTTAFGVVAAYVVSFHQLAQASGH